MRTASIVSAWLALGVLLYWIGARAGSRARSAARLQPPEPRDDRGALERRGALGAWLDLAGLRSPGARSLFLGGTVVGIALGAGVALLMTRAGVFDEALLWLEKMPGGIGQVFEPALYVGPWFCFFILALAPTLYVRATRRRRVRDIEKDLPLALDLFATLAESGISFDASMGRILDAQPADRALAHELRSFQVEVQSGTGRIESLRRLSRRMGVPAVSIFVSALVQAEQSGVGFAEVLRRQADDLRNRRSDRAMISAQALPVKLVFPLILCFLPMIFVSTLGPAFHQFFELTQNVTRNLR